LRAAEEENNILGILILIDADDDCSVTLANEIVQLVNQIGARYSVVVVVANREYEAWFLASLETVRGSENIPADSVFSGEIEGKSDVKGWLTKQMPKGKAYKENTHQVILTQKIDVDLALANSRSFRRLVHAIELLVDAADTGEAAISP